MKAVVNAKEMAAADRYTIEQRGVAGLTLMESAAEHCLTLLLPQLTSYSFVAVLSGPGNNGGDGFAIARLLKSKNVKVCVFLLGSKGRLQGDAALQAARLESIGLEICEIEDQDWSIPAACDWIVDALFGTGLRRGLSGGAAVAVEKINAHPAKVLSVDLPSGLCGDHGQVLGPHVKATLTATFQCLKFAHVVTPAMFSCGEVVVGEIGIQFPPETNQAFFLNAADYGREKRDPSTHKGSFGTLAVIGGFAGMEGAGNLCAKAALRFGAGKVRILRDLRSASSCDSVMSGEIEGAELSAYDAVVIGPGLSRREDVFERLARLDFSKTNAVWDADGLMFLKERGCRPATGEWVLTPHPGEAAALLGMTPAAVQADRLGAIERLHNEFAACWMVLKGFHTLVAAPNGELFIVGTGNPALATAGTGDVLAGMIGALLANGRPIEDAVLLATLRHGMAGDHWAARFRDYAMLAEDLIDDLKY